MEKGKKRGREKRRERTKETRKSTVNEILPRHRKTRPKTDRRHAIPPPPFPPREGKAGRLRKTSRRGPLDEWRRLIGRKWFKRKLIERDTSGGRTNAITCGLPRVGSRGWWCRVGVVVRGRRRLGGDGTVVIRVNCRCDEHIRRRWGTTVIFVFLFFSTSGYWKLSS